MSARTVILALTAPISAAADDTLRAWINAIVDETRAPTPAGGMGRDRHERLGARLEEIRAELRRRGLPSCEHHHFSAKVDVNRITDEAGAVNAFAVDLAVRCADCGEDFAFLCSDVGVLPDRPAVSVDRREMRLPIAPVTQPDAYRLSGGFRVTVKEGRPS